MLEKEKVIKVIESICINCNCEMDSVDWVLKHYDLGISVNDLFNN